MPRLSIIIPAYNEESRLPNTLLEIQNCINKQPYKTEVLVVDDGSTDGTVQAVKDIAKKFPELRLIENEVNKGKGGVVRQGMLEAKGDWRLFADADNSTPICQVEKLLKETENYEVIIGSRYLESDSIKIKQPWKRRMLSRLGNPLVQLLLLPGIKDTQCGFKLFSAEASEKIFEQQTQSGWVFDMEVLVIARKLGYKIKEVPVDWFDAANSQMRVFRSAVKSLRDIFVIFFKTKKGEKYIKN